MSFDKLQRLVDFVWWYDIVAMHTHAHERNVLMARVNKYRPYPGPVYLVARKLSVKKA